jgi:hypothetical protein
MDFGGVAKPSASLTGDETAKEVFEFLSRATNGTAD